MPVAIVTGAANGIGAAIAETLLKNGYEVCVIDIKEEEGKNFVETLESTYGSKVTFHDADTTSEASLRTAFDYVEKKWGGIDLLVNNAGILLEQNAKRTIDVNLVGTINGCQLGLKYMSKANGKKGGAIINTASIAGFIPFEQGPFYCASKHGVIGLTRSFGTPLHFNKHGVLFMAFCPSFTNTALLRSVPEKALVECPDVTSRPDVMSPEYVSQSVLKLLEDKINGATLLVTSHVGYQYTEVPSGFDDISF